MEYQTFLVDSKKRWVQIFSQWERPFKATMFHNKILPLLPKKQNFAKQIEKQMNKSNFLLIQCGSTKHILINCNLQESKTFIIINLLKLSRNILPMIDEQKSQQSLINNRFSSFKGKFNKSGKRSKGILINLFPIQIGLCLSENKPKIDNQKFEEFVNELSQLEDSIGLPREQRKIQMSQMRKQEANQRETQNSIDLCLDQDSISQFIQSLNQSPKNPQTPLDKYNLSLVPEINVQEKEKGNKQLISLRRLVCLITLIVRRMKQKQGLKYFSNNLTQKYKEYMRKNKKKFPLNVQFNRRLLPVIKQMDQLTKGDTKKISEIPLEKWMELDQKFRLRHKNQLKQDQDRKTFIKVYEIEVDSKVCEPLPQIKPPKRNRTENDEEKIQKKEGGRKKIKPPKRNRTENDEEKIQKKEGGRKKIKPPKRNRTENDEEKIQKKEGGRKKIKPPKRNRTENDEEKIQKKEGGRKKIKPPKRNRTENDEEKIQKKEGGRKKIKLNEISSNERIKNNKTKPITQQNSQAGMLIHQSHDNQMRIDPQAEAYVLKHETTQTEREKQEVPEWLKMQDQVENSQQEQEMRQYQSELRNRHDISFPLSEDSFEINSEVGEFNQFNQLYIFRQIIEVNEPFESESGSYFVQECLNILQGKDQGNFESQFIEQEQGEVEQQEKGDQSVDFGCQMLKGSTD